MARLYANEKQKKNLRRNRTKNTNPGEQTVKNKSRQNEFVKFLNAQCVPRQDRDFSLALLLFLSLSFYVDLLWNAMCSSSKVPQLRMCFIYRAYTLLYAGAHSQIYKTLYAYNAAHVNMDSVSRNTRLYQLERSPYYTIQIQLSVSFVRFDYFAEIMTIATTTAVTIYNENSSDAACGGVVDNCFAAGG